MLRDQARKFLAERSSRKAVREVLNDAAKSCDMALWKGVAEQGWLGAAIPEEFGGLGLGGLEQCVLAEEIGRAVAPIPFSSTIYFFAEAILAAGLTRAEIVPAADDRLQDLDRPSPSPEGPGAPSPTSIEASFRRRNFSGAKIPVTDGDIATHAVVLAREGQGCLSSGRSRSVRRKARNAPPRSIPHAATPSSSLTRPRPNASAKPAKAGNWPKPCSTAQPSSSPSNNSAAPKPASTWPSTTPRAATPSRQIGSFQAIKHKLADMYVAIELGRSNAYYGAGRSRPNPRSSRSPPPPPASPPATPTTSRRKKTSRRHGGMGFTGSRLPPLLSPRQAACCPGRRPGRVERKTRAPSRTQERSLRG